MLSQRLLFHLPPMMKGSSPNLIVVLMLLFIIYWLLSFKFLKIGGFAKWQNYPLNHLRN